jgi:hypothetical protein
MNVRLLASSCLALIVAFGAVAGARRSHTANPELPPPGPGVLRPVAVRDLPYGDALYYFYLGDYETALERLQFADSLGRLPHHRDDAKLLMGGIELTLGDYAQAARLFAEVLDQPNVPDNVRDRAHFYLGKTWYRRGYYEQAVTSLAAANLGTLPADFDAERRMLQAEALLALHRDADAAALLDGWADASVWRTYAQFNLGVAWIRSGNFDRGFRVLDTLGRTSTTDTEELALRDQANVALGYALVQQHRPKEALDALGRVRAQGAQAEKALLGAGWASADAGNYREALAPWLELRAHDVGDAAVQESYLAVPFAYARLGAEGQAAEAYEQALAEFEAETRRLDQAITAIRDGALIAAIEESKGGVGNAVGLDTAKVPVNRYLYRLLAKDEIQAALVNWKDLSDVAHRLDMRGDDLAAFSELVAYRRQRFQTQLPTDLASLDQRDLGEIVRRRTDLEARVSAADAHADLAELGTPRQRAIWDRLERMEALVDRVGDIDDPEVDDIADRVDFLKGYLYWEMSDGFKSRVWTARKRLRDVSHLVHEATRSYTLIKEARDKVPMRNDLLEKQLDALRPRLEGIHSRAKQLREQEIRAMGDMAIDELESEKLRLREYMLQARYSLATLYDRASTTPANQPVPKP